MDTSQPRPTGDSTIATAREEYAGERRIDVGIVVANTQGADSATLRAFADRMVVDGIEELAGATNVAWQFYGEEPTRIGDSGSRRPSEFLDLAINRMVDGPYDIVVVVTDAPLVSRRERLVPGLASPLGRTAVISTDQLRRGSRDEPGLPLDSETVRWNAAALFLHLIGHILGARHRRGERGVMEPFEVISSRRDVPTFESEIEEKLPRTAASTPQEEMTSRGFLRRLVFYLESAGRNSRQLIRTVVDSRAPFLPLSLPKLATAAVAPTLVIVFSAEAWDVGFHMTNGTAALFSVGSIVAAALYLVFAQSLLFPRQRRRVITEHAALLNIAVFSILLFAMLGLFVFVGSIILLIELVVFPPNLISNWPSLEDPSVGFLDLIRTAVFISTIGVLSGALAGGIESRAIIRQLTLFLDRP